MESESASESASKSKSESERGGGRSGSAPSGVNQGGVRGMDRMDRGR